MATTTVYTKPDCRQCDMTKKTLDRAGTPYTTVDISLPENAADLAAVATRHGATITGPAVFKVVDGRTQPGSQGAEQCVVATAPAITRKRNYGRTAA